MARRIESYLLDGPAGKLEALLEEPEEGVPSGVALVCHPHPLFGGTMHNKVVYRTARALRHAGYVVLRFNFRAVGRSQGEHDEGIGEIEDARAALDWLRARYPDLPFTLAGFSFGSKVILKLGCQEWHTLQRAGADFNPRKAGQTGPQSLIALGFPAKHEHERAGFLEHCPARKIFVQSTNDEFGMPKEMEPLFARVAEPKQLVWVEATDHFFSGGLDRLETALGEVLSGS